MVIRVTTKKIMMKNFVIGSANLFIHIKRPSSNPPMSISPSVDGMLDPSDLRYVYLGPRSPIDLGKAEFDAMR